MEQPDEQMTGHNESNAALLIIDMVNPLDFDGAAQLQRHAAVAARALATLKMGLKRQGVPIIYANDNFSDWQRDFPALVRACRNRADSAALIEPIMPEADDLFVLKPMHSAFFHSPLQVLLQQRGIDHVVLAGVAGDGCVLASALDAHMRQLHVTLATDAIASSSLERNGAALRLLEDAIGADVRDCVEIVARLRNCADGDEYSGQI